MSSPALRTAPERFNLPFDLTLGWIIAAGVAIRVGFIVVGGVPGDAAEAENVATAIALGHGIADAYFAGSGPTAHLTPTMPAIAGLVHRLLGVRTTSSAIVLEIMLLGMIFSSLWLLAHAFVKIGVSRLAALGAALVFSVVPLFVNFEIYYFRYWEGALAVLLQSLVFAALVYTDARAPRPLVVLTLATAPALLTMVLPALGIAAVAMTGLALLWQRRWRLIAAVTAGFIVTGAAIFVPWTVRNAEIMGRPIFLRSNLGLELALGMGKDVHTLGEFLDRTVQLHPFQNGPGRKAYQAEGELAYYDRLLRETTHDIAAHPAESVQIALRHMRQMVVPDIVEFALVDGGRPRVRAIFYSLVAVTGILGFLVGSWFTNWHMLLPLLQVAIVVDCYAPFQPISRYLYVNYPFLLFGATFLAAELVRSAGALWRNAGPATLRRNVSDGGSSG